MFPGLPQSAEAAAPGGPCNEPAPASTLAGERALRTTASQQIDEDRPRGPFQPERDPRGRHRPCLIYAYKFEFPSESGMAIQIVSDAHALARLGITVILFVTPSPAHRIASVAEGLRFYGFDPLPGLRITRLPFARKSLRKKLGAAIFWAAVSGALVRHRAAPPLVVSRSRRITRRLLALRRWLPIRYRIAHEIHEDGTRGLPPERAERLEVARERALLERVDAVIATSPVVARHIRDAYGLGARVHCIPNGADTERFLPIEPRRAGSADKAECVLAYAGSFNAWKQVSLAIECLAHLPSNVRLILMGGKQKYRETDRGWLDDLTRRLAVADRVSYRGFVSPPDLPAQLAEADILLLPLGDNAVARYFTSPLKLFEYMATGRPIIAPAYPSITPFLTHGVSGYLVDPMTPETIAQAVSELRQNPALAASLGQRAREEAPRYSRARRAAALAELVRETVR
jgi:glycosyltransferase involved in cell wall biosynthesis